jgi:SWI/SNF chromatin-remodeling complex subunit SWI1
VEYKPLHYHHPTLAGWDPRAVASTFPVNNMKQQSRSAYELGIVDMEAILMGLRSRLPRELGYAMTALSMLSMPHPEERVGGLPIENLEEIYIELLELIEESCFGECGWISWVNRQASDVESRDLASLGECSDMNRVRASVFEKVGMDLDWTLEQDEEAKSTRPRDSTGGSTDIVLAGINLLRNFTMLAENQAYMVNGRPELFQLLSRITDARLCRLPGEVICEGKPYSVHELARVRRDAVAILGNVGPFMDLRIVDFESVTAIFRVLSSFICSGWEIYLTKETIYGPTTPIRDTPLTLIYSITRSVEAFVKLAAADLNREILSKIPHEELMDLFDGIIRLLPVSSRASEAMHTQEEHLILTEHLAHALYSLAFLSPPATRATMRSRPGALSLLLGMISHTASLSYEFKTNPFGVLCRRLCEVLGVLNGTVGSAGVEVEKMSFSAGSGGGKGWRFNSEIVEKGWLAGMEDVVFGCLGVRGLDVPAFGELDGMWWAGDGLGM